MTIKNRSQPVTTGCYGPVFFRSFVSKKKDCDCSPVFSSSVRSGFGFFPVHRTGLGVNLMIGIDGIERTLEGPFRIVTILGNRGYGVHFFLLGLLLANGTKVIQ
jgi:hypothetical protein